MQSLPRLHWTTLGESTRGVESRWVGQWEITIDRNAAPALPPKETDLWVISVGGQAPPHALVRMSGELAALPTLLLLDQEVKNVPTELLSAWSAMGSARWGILGNEPPLPGLRPMAHDRPPLTSAQSLSLGLVGVGQAMQKVLADARAAAATKATVLLIGESGTGKELVAKAIHRMSAEASGPFVAVHCGAIPENLLESELFGYTKGAYTDAKKDSAGKFREAHEGTLFLDEVATMPLAAQVRLLRVLQEREVQPLGGGGPVKVDVRVVVATNQDLWKKVQEGTFREDLYYRLDVVPITLPPLRDRRDEIPYLAQHFLNRKAREHGLYPKALHPSVDPLLSALPWPGNARQLENAIERAIVLSSAKPVMTREDFTFLLARMPEGEAMISALPPVPLFLDAQAANHAQELDLPPEGLDLNQVVSEIEKKLILQALLATRGNKKQAAEMLNTKRTTLLEKIKRLGIQDEDGPPE